MRPCFRLRTLERLISSPLLASYPVLAIALAVSLLAGCAPFRILRDTSHRECTPSFGDVGGWYGADAAFSVALSDEADRRTLWLFGDTFVERDADPGRRSYPFIHNSIGLSVCDDRARFSFTPHWGGRETATPHAFFEPSSDAAWVRDANANAPNPAYYWPFGGFVFEGVLYVGLLRVVPHPPSGPLRLPFRLAGMDLARIDNPNAAPTKWNIAIEALSDDHELIPGAAFVLDAGYVYAFAFFQSDGGRAQRALTRFPLAALRSRDTPLPQTFETLTSDDEWVSGIRPEIAKIVMEDDATEMSVHRDKALDRWIAVDSSPLAKDAMLRNGNAIRLRSAKQLAGPWSLAISLHVMSETIRRPGAPPDPNLTCYAGKAHPQFSTVDSLLVTYVCNLFASTEGEEWAVLERLVESPRIYRPIAVRVPIPALETGSIDSRGGDRNGLP